MARFFDRRPSGKRRRSNDAHARSDTARRPSPARDGSGSAAPAHRRAGLRELLDGIGAPAPAPFAPDPFQLEALARLEHEDVLVTAPTGSGKTWIAREEIRRLLAAGKQAWYTSPLKALTNSKYVEFAQEFGAENVGILTGDRKENHGAPLIVGTTEVYRNQLFDALREGGSTSVDLVILDEAHYLGDPERGHVWEETIILCPPRVRMLLLSATVGNSAELARWIAAVRGTKCSVVERKDEHGRRAPRPVPLRAAFLFPDGGLAPLTTEARSSEMRVAEPRSDERRALPARELNPEVRSFLQREGARSGIPSNRFDPRRRATGAGQEMPPADLLSALGNHDLLPAIVFLPTRRRCDESAAESALGGIRGGSDERRQARLDFLRDFSRAHPEILKHKHWDSVVKSGAAAHHAGHLPAWKSAVEHMMVRGLLDAIFATSTVAAGVDFPARTVVLSVADTRSDDGWRPLAASEFQQMTGRAGRRGKDRVGFIVVAPGRHQNPAHIARLLDAAPDDLTSQYRATYTTLLNLLDAYGGFPQVQDIVERSFAHVELASRIACLDATRRDAENRIAATLRAAGRRADERGIASARALERLAAARARLQESLPETREESALRWLDEQVVPGRVVGIGRGGGGARGRRLVYVTERRGQTVIGTRETGARATLALDRIGRVYSEIYSPANSDEAFAATLERRNPALREPRRTDARTETDAATELINDFVDRVVSDVNITHDDARQSGVDDGGSHVDPAAHDDKARVIWSTLADAGRAHAAERDMEVLRDEAWQPFARRAGVLDHFGYLERARGRVTERGRWLADLRVDRPLLVGEALEAGLLADLEPPTLAACVAAFAADSERSFGELQLDNTLVDALARFEQIAYKIADVEAENDLEPAPEMNYSAAATVARWAQGVRWETLVRQSGAEEGDLFRLLSRVGEALLQIAHLRQTHPEAAARAKRAASAILREPVRSDDVL